MHSITPKSILAASCILMYMKPLFAAPIVEVVKVLQVRQDDGEDNPDDGVTDPLRQAYDYRSHYTNDQTPTWSTISVDGNSGTYQVYTTGNPRPTVPPEAAGQGQGNSFQVDHVLELQVVASFVKSANPLPQSIPDASWSSLGQVVTQPGSQPQRTPIASALGSFDNLAGIPNSPNAAKGQAFRAALQAEPPALDALPYINDANRKYLIDRYNPIQNVITAVAEALGNAGGGGDVGGNIAFEFASFASQIYNNVIANLGGQPTSKE